MTIRPAGMVCYHPRSVPVLTLLVALGQANLLDRRGRQPPAQSM